MKRERLKKLAENYMSWIGPIGNFMFYFQAGKIFMTSKASDISLSGFIISLIAMSSWLIYGVIMKDRALIITNTIGFIGVVAVLTGVAMYI
ncbi:SemiSWEET family transporter [Enterobacteriaceae bacterium LUAb1]